jgi:hypothetical protein
LEDVVQIRHGNTLQSLRGVQAFLDEHAEKLPGLKESGARKRLDALIEEMGAHAAAQTGSVLASKGATQKQYALRVALLEDHMAPIARIAAADLPDTPELAPLRMPQGRLTTEALAKAADGMLETAQPHSAVFIAAGLEQDFIERFRGAVAALLGSLDVRTASRSKRRGATRGMKETVRAARRNVRVLDAFVRRSLRGNAVLLERWAAVKRPPSKTGKAAPTRPVDVPEPSIPSAPVAPPADRVETVPETPFTPPVTGESGPDKAA